MPSFLSPGKTGRGFRELVLDVCFRVSLKVSLVDLLRMTSVNNSEKAKQFEIFTCYHHNEVLSKPMPVQTRTPQNHGCWEQVKLGQL